MTHQNWPITAEIVAELPEAVGNITFTPKSDVIFCPHPFFEPDIRVAKLNEARRRPAAIITSTPFLVCAVTAMA